MSSANGSIELVETMISVDLGPGPVWLKATGDRLTGVHFTKPDHVPERTSPILQEAKAQIEAYRDGRLKRFDIPVRRVGTAFQERVWSMLQEIPFASTTTYSGIASKLGGIKWSRAAGTACGANPFPIVIPCHRVLAGNGGLAGYLGGLEWKRWLLLHEGVGAGLFQDAPEVASRSGNNS